jgi:heat shock protein HslJ
MSGMAGSFFCLLSMAAIVLTGCTEQDSDSGRQADIETPAEDGPGSPDFDYQNDHAFTSAPWEYRYSVGCKGTRSEGYFGVLLYNGNEVPVPGSINDHYQTPWGPLYWVGDPGTLFGDHGWMAHPLEREPIGSLLPDPAETAVQTDPGTNASESARLSSLAGQTWQLTQLSREGMESTLLLDVQRLPTITIEDSVYVNGFGGVNNWYATYAEPAPGEISWSDFTTTEMFGDSPEQDLEISFFEALTSTCRTHITEDELVLSNADSTIAVAFELLP